MIRCDDRDDGVDDTIGQRTWAHNSSGGGEGLEDEAATAGRGTVLWSAQKPIYNPIKRVKTSTIRAQEELTSTSPARLQALSRLLRTTPGSASLSAD